MIKPQKDFPLMARYKEAAFAITKYTIFAYNGDIYTDYSLPPWQLVHENRHLKQQEEIGLDLWVEQYLTDASFRLKMELDAFRTELASIKDRNKRFEIRMDASYTLSSDLYGRLVTRSEALRLLMQPK